MDSIIDLSELDEKVIVKLNNKFCMGNIFIDGMMAICNIKLSFLNKESIEVDISNRTRVDLSSLIDLFEQTYSEQNFELMDIYEESDYIYLAKDCIAKIPHRSVQQFCRNTLRQLEQEDEFPNQVELLNQILTFSLLSPDNLPSREEGCVYQTERSLFEIRSKRSSKENTIYRFNIAKRVYNYLKNQEGGEFSVRIELLHSKTKIRFHVYSNYYLENEPLFSESRAVLFNSDKSSVRVNFPPAVFGRLNSHGNELDLFIELENNEILFSFYD